MASFSNLPVELLVRILGMLDRRSLKTVRLVSKYHSPIVESFMFSEVVFDLDVGGIDGLVNIAKSPTLREHVQTIRLHRRSGPKDFGAYEDWHELSVYEYIVPEGLDDDGHDDSKSDYEVKAPTESPMSKQEWEALSDIARRHLYEDYERQRVALQRHIGRLGIFIRARILGEEFDDPSGTTNDKNDDRLARIFLQTFEQALKGLSRLSGFSHEPAHLDETWGTSWRRLRFNSYGIIARHDLEEETYIDALQLFLCLRTLAFTRDAGRGELRSSHMYTGGTAFWRPRDLMALLNRLRRDGTPSRRPEDGWIHDMLAYEDLDIAKTEHLTRELVSIEHGFFSELKDLHWDIRYDTLHHEGSDNDHPGVGWSLSHILHNSRRLKKLNITFSRDTTFQDLSDASYWSRGPDLTDTSSQRLPLRPSVYKELRAASIAWLHPSRPGYYAFQCLQAAELSVVTVEQDLWAFLSALPALRHLTLRHVALLPTGGCWESVLWSIREHLQLQTIQLAMLEDATLTHDLKQMIPRAILRPTEDIWRDCPGGAHCYQSHEDAILNYALSRSTLLPSLVPDELRHSHV